MAKRTFPVFLKLLTLEGFTKLWGWLKKLGRVLLGAAGIFIFVVFSFSILGGLAEVSLLLVRGYGFPTLDEACAATMGVFLLGLIIAVFVVIPSMEIYRWLRSLWKKAGEETK